MDVVRVRGPVGLAVARRLVERNTPVGGEDSGRTVRPEGVDDHALPATRRGVVLDRGVLTLLVDVDELLRERAPIVTDRHRRPGGIVAGGRIVPGAGPPVKRGGRCARAGGVWGEDQRLPGVRGRASNHDKEDDVQEVHAKRYGRWLGGVSTGPVAGAA